MGVYTFICKKSGGDSWSAKQYSGELEGSADSSFDLQRQLVNAALSAEGSAPVQSSFSYTTPSTAIFQVIVGGAVAAGGFIGGVGAAPAAGGGGAAAEEPKNEEKKEEEKEESDDDMGFSLFD